MNDLKARVQTLLDAEMPTAREGDSDLALLLARTRRHRGLVWGSAVPAALATAAVVAFVVVRGHTPLEHNRDEPLYISVADAGDPQSAVIIDLRLSPQRKGR